jgi:hypothetical protein
VAVFVNPANQSTPIALTAMQHMAGSLGVELMTIEVGAREEIADAILTVATRRAGALVAIEDPMFISNATQIAALAAQHGLQQPAMRSCDIEEPSPAKGPKSFRLSHSSFDSGRFG